jgi:mRNA-degrading endonuclease toxin of MazEF toxin-antitoxin module
MTTYEKGDIVLVPFPFSNQTATKKRPAVVVSSTAYNQISPDIVIMAITSQPSRTHGIYREISLLKRLGKLSTKDIISMENVLLQLLSLK